MGPEWNRAATVRWALMESLRAAAELGQGHVLGQQLGHLTCQTKVPDLRRHSEIAELVRHRGAHKNGWASERERWGGL